MPRAAIRFLYGDTEKERPLSAARKIFTHTTCDRSFISGRVSGKIRSSIDCAILRLLFCLLCGNFVSRNALLSIHEKYICFLSESFPILLGQIRIRNQHIHLFPFGIGNQSCPRKFGTVARYNHLRRRGKNFFRGFGLLKIPTCRTRISARAAAAEKGDIGRKAADYIVGPHPVYGHGRTVEPPAQYIDAVP